eukprot:1195080-Prorocentrum_minimum.AAC.1
MRSRLGVPSKESRSKETAACGRVAAAPGVSGRGASASSTSWLTAGGSTWRPQLAPGVALTVMSTSKMRPLATARRSPAATEGAPRGDIGSSSGRSDGSESTSSAGCAARGVEKETSNQSAKLDPPHALDRQIRRKREHLLCGAGRTRGGAGRLERARATRTAGGGEIIGGVGNSQCGWGICRQSGGPGSPSSLSRAR